jgi:hypothetical protein
MKRIGIGLVMALVAVPALAQEGSFQQVLSPQGLPHTLKLKELNGEWRHLGIKGTEGSKSDAGDMLKQLMQLGMMANGDKGKNAGGDAAMGMMFLSMMGGMFGGGSGGDAPPAYYSKGQTIQLGGETFLVTYRYQPPANNLMQMAMQAGIEGKEPDLAKMLAAPALTEESDLTLTLVNARTIGTITDIRTFDLKKELEASQKAGGGGLMDLIVQGMKEGNKGADDMGHRHGAEPTTLAVDVVSVVNQALTPDAALRKPGNQITVAVSGDVAILKGTVSSQYMKSRAALLAQQAILQRAGGRYTVRNQLVIRATGRR